MRLGNSCLPVSVPTDSHTVAALRTRALGSRVTFATVFHVGAACGAARRVVDMVKDSARKKAARANARKKRRLGLGLRLSAGGHGE